MSVRRWRERCTEGAQNYEQVVLDLEEREQIDLDTVRNHVHAQKYQGRLLAAAIILEMYHENMYFSHLK